MQVYKSILVTIDCSPVDEVILEHVARLAVQNRARVTLLHVVHSHTLDQERAMRAAAERALHHHVSRLSKEGIDARIVIRSGEPDKEVLAAVEGEDYDLVAMATHGHAFLGDLLFGSVSKKLKHKIDVPLLLIKADRPPRLRRRS